MPDAETGPETPPLTHYDHARRTSSLAAQDKVESALFARARWRAVESAEITRFVGRYVFPGEVSAAITAEQASIWRAVSTPLLLFRDCMNALSQARQAVRRGVYDEHDEPKWIREREELGRQLSSAQEYLATKRRARSQAANDAVMTRVKATVEAAEAEILRAGTVAEGLSGPATADGAATTAGKRRRRQTPAAGSAPDPVEQVEREFRKAEESLGQIQRGFADFASAEERRRLALEPEIDLRMRQDTACQTAMTSALAARDALAEELLAQGTLPAARTFVNSRIGNLTSVAMEIPPESGLYDTLPRSSPVITEAIEQVLNWLRRMKGASLGIAGPRGAGKTTLMDYFCLSESAAPGTREWVRLRVSAPVEYVALDFIRHLLFQLSTAILQLHPGQLTATAPSAPPADGPLKRTLRRLRSMRTASTPPLLLGLRVLALLAVPLIAASTASAVRPAHVAIIVSALSMFFTMLLWLRESGRRRPSRGIRSVILLAPVAAVVAVAVTALPVIDPRLVPAQRRSRWAPPCGSSSSRPRGRDRPRP